ncbi:hypothetical protein PCYB_022000 [Plasmodium cynomolgi strain B]|uniref:Parasite-infected erythrocyte surface protein n=1 Tax=Plasmodium cynomolgi (strain B) TaxID=1120755 RepID=K6URW4_PLACD|nr:hypothetical protein PCYB_022000 [Plasmodium cynomolgi strain B]GAB64630.1 hypothetical protein PCYB_022000 [Plasmodium cynomolgi strain B]
MARFLLALIGLLCWSASRHTSASGSSTNSGSGGMYVSPAHSFNSPFTVNDLSNGWVLNYSTASTNKYLVLIPNVYNRRGFLYHSKPILSDTLNIEFSFHIRKEFYKEHIDDSYYKSNQVKEITYKNSTEEKNKINGFAFWLLPNEFSLPNVNKEGEVLLEEDQYGLYGFKKDFNGIGVGFQLRGNDLVLSGLINNGKKNLNLKENVTKSYSLNLLSIEDLIYVKITTQKNEMRVYLYNASNNSYIHSLTELKLLAEKAQKLETIISKGNSTSYFFSFAFAALIILTLILIYKKIRDVEKKHIL